MRRCDAIVVGAGFGGIQALYHLREKGFDTHLVEAGSGLGGTWFWNKYPGARVDIESLEYSYGFSNEIQQDWKWKERFSAQPDVEAYLNFVADKLDLRRNMQFDTRIVSARYDEALKRWRLQSESGELFEARFVFWALGFLAHSFMPDIKGRDSFKGRLVHTSRWPDEGIELAGKRVGCIGVGATGVQFVPVVAESASHLYVFQRTPNWCMPQRNEPMPESYEQFVKENYQEIRSQEHAQRGPGIVLFDYKISQANTRSPLDYTPEEREAIYEAHWQKGGATHMSRAFFGLNIDPAANDTLREFLTKKIRQIVKDPAIAEKLIPDHPPLTRRPCGEYGYYEAFNRDNVTLVDCKQNGIAEIVPEGVKLADGSIIELDVLAFATGFDAGAGALKQIRAEGREGRLLSDVWAEGVQTHVGLMVDGFPNMFCLGGAQSPAAHFSPPLLVVYQTDFALRLIDAAARFGGTVEPTRQAVESWSNHVAEVIGRTLVSKTDSWWMSANIPGKPRQAVAYAGGFSAYRNWCEQTLEKLEQSYHFASAAQRSLAEDVID